MKMTRSELINALIKKYSYTSYLEIGVNTPKQPGYNWNSVNLPTKDGVDPNPATKATYVMTSDEFFEKHISKTYDIVFVDGMHLMEFAYRDIVHSLAHLSDNGTIVVHDCNPIYERTQVREHVAGAWHGDVWKAILKLRMENPDISIRTVDTDEGCAVIRKGRQELFKVSKGVDPYTFAFFDAHRKEILNLVSIKQFIEEFGMEDYRLKKNSKWNMLTYLLMSKYKKSYSQCGEDIIVSKLLKNLGVTKPFYVDIGANDPVIHSNTYLFYKNGSKGITIEPNQELSEKIKRKRPRDIVLSVGVGARNATATYYVFKNHVLNTFSEKEALETEKKGQAIIAKRDLPIVTFSTILTEQKIRAIDFLSLDVEGLDFEVLSSIDFSLTRPKVISVETKSFNDSLGAQNSPIIDLLKSKNYEMVSMTPINTIFADKNLLGKTK